MKLLSRPEELLLLAIWRLQADAYAVEIRKQLKGVTGKVWSFGALFISLERLVKKGYLESYLGPPTPKRGGRSKRIYKLTPVGQEELVEIKKIEHAMWEGISGLSVGENKM